MPKIVDKIDVGFVRAVGAHDDMIEVQLAGLAYPTLERAKRYAPPWHANDGGRYLKVTITYEEVGSDVEAEGVSGV